MYSERDRDAMTLLPTSYIHYWLTTREWVRIIVCSNGACALLQITWVGLLRGQSSTLTPGKIRDKVFTTGMAARAGLVNALYIDFKMATVCCRSVFFFLLILGTGCYDQRFDVSEFSRAILSMTNDTLGVGRMQVYL